MIGKELSGLPKPGYFVQSDITQTTVRASIIVQIEAFAVYSGHLFGRADSGRVHTSIRGPACQFQTAVDIEVCQQFPEDADWQ